MAVNERRTNCPVSDSQLELMKLLRNHFNNGMSEERKLPFKVRHHVSEC